jgi:hypothetical protein
MVVTSVDGGNTFRSSQPCAAPGCSLHQLQAFGDQWIVLGQERLAAAGQRSMWRSPDGMAWTKVRDCHVADPACRLVATDGVRATARSAVRVGRIDGGERVLRVAPRPLPLRRRLGLGGGAQPRHAQLSSDASQPEELPTAATADGHAVYVVWDLRELWQFVPADLATVRPIDAACPQRSPRGQYVDVPTSFVHARAIDCVTWWEVARGRTSTTYEPHDR